VAAHGPRVQRILAPSSPGSIQADGSLTGLARLRLWFDGSVLCAENAVGSYGGVQFPKKN
jgi:hypothetical protein